MNDNFNLNIIIGLLSSTAKALLKDLNKSTPKQAAKSELDKEMLIEAPTVVPGLKKKDEATKITKTKVEDKPDHFEVLNNIELATKPQTISSVAGLTTQYSSVETGKATVHSALRTTEDINKEAKTNGKKSSHKGEDNNVKTNNNKAKAISAKLLELFFKNKLEGTGKTR